MNDEAGILLFIVGWLALLVFLAGYAFGKVSGRAECRKKHGNLWEEENA